MSDPTSVVQDAQALLDTGHEARAVELLHEAIETTDDAELLRRIHELAMLRHGRAEGFQKMEWHKLVVESEARPVVG